jgi:PKD repeat protein
MRKIYTSIVLFITLSIGAIAQQSHISGEVMVMLDPRLDVKKIVEDLNKEHPGASFHVSQEVTAEWNIWLLSFDSQFISDEAALLMVNRFDGITMAQYNYPVELRVTPNDASFTQQWAHNNTGQSGGTVDADIDAPEAWEVTTGGTTVQGDVIVVAVIDGGFQANHPDLVDNYWINTAEIPGNGIDDDANGYIDDVNGWNAYNNNGSIPSDQHGTHVAGIIGAKGNNGIGVSGVNWNVKIMRVAGSSGNTATVVSAYAYVAKQRKIYNETNGAQGAFVVSTNSSFGVNQQHASSYPIWCAFYDTLGTLGILNAGSVPNLGINIDVEGDIPGTCPSIYMIGVTNTTRTDTRNSGAGYGAINVDIGAPGTQIYSTVTGSTYSSMTGTSMAGPQVAGAIGLYYAAAGPNFMNYYKSNVAAGAVLMRNYLLTGVDSIPTMATITSSKGRLNLFKGIQQVQAGENTLPEPILPPVASFTLSDSSICAGESILFSDQSTNVPTSWNWAFVGGTPPSSILQNPTVIFSNAGTFNVSLTATNAGGSHTQTVNSVVTVNANPAAPSITNMGGVFQSNYTTGNQWYGPNGLIVGATSQDFTPPSNGNYYVIHTDNNGCVSSASESVLLNVSIEDLYFENFTVYPNPIGSQFSVSWQSSKGLVSGIKLIDSNGRLVYQANVSGNSVTVQADGLASGSYKLVLQTEKGDVVKSLVK